MPEPRWYCSICLFTNPRDYIRQGDALTVVNGQMVCIDHAGYATSYATSGDHGRMVSAARRVLAREARGG